MTFADNQPIKGLKKGKFSILSLLGAPDCPAECNTKTAFLLCAICRAILALCGDDADVRERIRHAVSVALMLVNTDALYATTSCLELVPGLMLRYGDGDGR